MTVAWPCLDRLTERCSTAAFAALALGLGLGGCEIGFVDRGGSFVVDNRSDLAVLARITKATPTGSGWEAMYEVVGVPAASRLVVAVQGFGGDQVIEIEVLDESCDSIGTFSGWEQGALFLVGRGPTATQTREWPDETEPRAAVADACPLASTSPSP